MPKQPENPARTSIRARVLVCSHTGIHARTSYRLCTEVKGLDAIYSIRVKGRHSRIAGQDVFVPCDVEAVSRDGEFSIMEIMCLTVDNGAELEITCSGKQAAEAFEQMRLFFTEDEELIGTTFVRLEAADPSQ